MIEQRICAYCNKDITTEAEFKVNLCGICLTHFRNIRAEYGSYTEELNEKEKFVYFHLKQCPQCEDDFWASQINKKYCNENCKYENNNKSRILIRKNQMMGKMVIRFEQFKSDNFHCVYCGRGVEDGIKLQLDHIKPRFKGGSDLADNFVTSCNECNIGKFKYELAESRLKKGK